jgi:hypothetical protein
MTYTYWTMNKFKSQHKQNVRYMIHSAFVDHKCKRALFLPSSQRDELDSLLGLGFAPSNLIAVEQSPQILANFTRRLSPNEHASLIRYRSKLSDAAVDLRRLGISVDAANLDFCYTIRKAAPEIIAFLKAGILDPQSIVAIQVFGGRDDLFGHGRIRAIDAAVKKGLTINGSYERLFECSYRNETSKSIMRYAVYSISSEVSK